MPRTNECESRRMQNRVRRVPGRMQGCETASITDRVANTRRDTDRIAFAQSVGADSDSDSIARLAMSGNTRNFRSSMTNGQLLLSVWDSLSLWEWVRVRL